MNEERAFSVLSIRGVSRERAKSIANGIDVLATRYEREIAVLRQAVDDLGMAAVAYRDLATCYRIGKRPTEALFKALDNATKPLAAFLAQRPVEPSAKGDAQNEIARRFSGPEGDAAADSLRKIPNATWVCAGCGNVVRQRELVIDPGNNYFYHEKPSGEICGRYELAVEPSAKRREG